MKYILITILCLVLVILYLIKRRKAICKVKRMKKLEKIEIVNKALYPFGFAYDEFEDIIISNNNAWQREMGYSNFYDIHAPLLNIVMDCEPIYFNYNNKEYRIEFWKGQYGITTGAEVGIYEKDIDSPNKIYYSVPDSEMLYVQFELFKRRLLFKRCDYTWWLTGFVLGLFSKPKELMLKVKIYFPNILMQAAFVEGLFNAGYKESNIKIYGNMVSFSFCKPKNIYLNNKHKLIKFLAQILNYLNCKLFNLFTKPFNCTLDKLVFIKELMPCILKFSMPRKKQKKCHKKSIK